MFAGILQFNPNSATSEKLIKMHASETGLAHIPYEDKAQWQSEFGSGQLTVLQQRFYNTHQSANESGIISHKPSKCRILAWARIDNRINLREELDGFSENLLEHDTGLILAAYLKWGEDCANHLIGDYSFVIIDPRNNSLFFGRDHLGVRPLYYYQDDNCFAFATSLAILNELPAIDLSPSEEWIAYYMTCFPKDWGITAYKNIKKCLPGHTMQLKDKRLKQDQYFDLKQVDELHLGSDEEYVEAYRELLHESVICRLNTAYPLGSESSGGLDSSTITAIAAMRLPHAGQHLHALGYDEDILTGQYILEISRHFPVRETHFFSKTRETNPYTHSDFMQTFGAPNEHPNSTSHEPIYHACEKNGLRTLLSGFGGDEFVTTEAPVALVEFWLNKQYRLFLSRQRGNLLTKPLHTSRWLYNFYRHNNHSITSRSAMAVGDVGWAFNPLQQEYLTKYPLREIVEKNIIYDGGKKSQNEFALTNRWSPTITARFENCVLMAARYGIEYRWPLMDIRLLKFFLSVPAEQKLGPGQVGRYLHRRAVNGLLPDDIAWKEKKMRKLSKWQRISDAIQRQINRHKLRHLSTSTLKKWQQNSHATAQAKANQKNDQFENLHPQLQNLLDSNKFQHLIDTLNSPQIEHRGVKLSAQLRLLHIKFTNMWLNKINNSTKKQD